MQSIYQLLTKSKGYYCGFIALNPIPGRYMHGLIVLQFLRARYALAITA